MGKVGVMAAYSDPLSVCVCVCVCVCVLCILCISWIIKCLSFIHGTNMKRTKCVSIRKINWLVLKTDTADVYRDIYTEHTNCVRKIWNILM